MVVFGSVFGRELLGCRRAIHRLVDDADGFMDFDVICTGQRVPRTDVFRTGFSGSAGDDLVKVGEVGRKIAF